MSLVNLSPESISAISLEVANLLKAQGLAIVPIEMAQKLTDDDFDARRKQLLSEKYVTPYKIWKFKLLENVKSLDTVKNMVKDGRIPAKFVVVDKKNRMKISTLFLTDHFKN